MLPPPGITQDFEIPEEMMECTVFYNFLSDLIQKRGLLNKPKNELFLAPKIVDHKLVFKAPHGWYDSIVTFFDADMNEVAEGTQALISFVRS